MKPPAWIAYVLSGVMVGCVLMWVVLPRYQIDIPITQGLGMVVVQTDRWTGRVEWMRVSPETVRRYTGGVLTERQHAEEPDVSFDGDEQRLAGGVK